MYPNTQAFKTIIRILLKTAESSNQEYLDINAGKLHRFIGGYPQPNNRMPVCNSAMKQLMQNGDLILAEPPSGQGAKLTIRYFVPRTNT